MARVLPDPLVGNFSSGVHRVYRALRAIPGDDLLVWVGLPFAGAEDRPDFLVVHQDSTAFVLSVSPETDADIDEHLNGGLFADPAKPPMPPPGEARLARIRGFIAQALGEGVATTGGSLTIPASAVYGLLLFPNAAHATVAQLWPDNPHEGCHWLGDDYLSASKLAACLRKLATGGLEERQLALLRSHFTPETVVPPRFSPRAPIRRDVAAGLSPMLLSYDQEAWAKNRLHLPDEQLEVAEAPAPYGGASLVTGVAGSGKSLVLLFRACTQARLHPESRALVITHNQALRRELEDRFGELGNPPNVVWHTFHSWVLSELRHQKFDTREIVQYAKRDALIAEAVGWDGAPVDSRRVAFLRDEFDWMQDQGLTGRARYLEADRAGRGGALSPQQRARIHDIYLRYSARLDELRAEDWSGRALRFFSLLERGDLRPAAYDYIYVDEAQFFAQVWLRALQHYLQPLSGRLLLAADPTQGFLKRRQSWLACGIDLRGRSTRLRRAYRNTRAILAFAAAFYRARLGDDEETDLNLPGPDEFATAPDGLEPRLIPLGSRQDEASRLINEIHAYLREGGEPGSILVLAGTGLGATATLEALVAEFGTGRVARAKDPIRPGCIRVSGLDAATGLEAPVVFVIGCAELLEAEGDLQLDADQRAELRRDNTRRLYMAFTRAGQRLVITWTGPVPPELAGAGGESNLSTHASRRA